MKSSSYIVWFTVPLPVIFIFFMVLRGLTLENAPEGIRMYLLGEGFAGKENLTWQDKLALPDIWTEACAQIFFSIGVCMGIMTSYASYNDTDKPIIGPACQVAFGNSLLSFFAGFAVFSTVGYLRGINSPISSSVSSIGLAFIAYPTAIDTLPYSNGWALMLALTLFTLGLDSAFSMVEAVSTVIADTAMGEKTPRWIVALVLCFLGGVISTIFCSNWGFTYFDVVDHYLANYLMLIVGILQCFGSCWMINVHYYRDKEDDPKRYMSVKILAIGYWIPLIILGVLGNFIDSTWALPGSIIAFWVIQLLVWLGSWLSSGRSFVQWYKEVFFYGARPLAIMIANGSNPERDQPAMWRYPFEFWWSFSMKYFFSWAVWTLMMRYFRNDLPLKEGETFYGNYHGFWQLMGFLYPLIGIVMFIVCALLCTTREEGVELDRIEAAFTKHKKAPTGPETEEKAPEEADKSPNTNGNAEE